MNVNKINRTEWKRFIAKTASIQTCLLNERVCYRHPLTWPSYSDSNIRTSPSLVKILLTMFARASCFVVAGRVCYRNDVITDENVL